MEGCIVRAKYDFPKEADTDLSLKVGDIVKIIKNVNDEWCIGIQNKQQGQFPIAFVDVLLEKAAKEVFLAVADFSGQEDGDINFKKDEIISLTEDVDENWFVGVSKNSSGLCPRSFVKELNFDSNHEEIARDSQNDKKSDGPVEVKETADKVKVTPYGESVDAFSAQGSDELTFPKGVKIELVKEIDSFWTEGIYNDKQGKFPSLFIKVIEPLPEELQFKETEIERSGNVTPETEPSAKALFMYIGASSDELSFDKGDIVILKERVNNEWYRGQIGKTKGLFPANYVEIIVDLPFEKIPEPKKVEKVVQSTGNSLRGSLQTKKEESSDKPSLKQKPLLLQPKPAVKQKPTQPKPMNLSQNNTAKPLLLTSLKQQQKPVSPTNTTQSMHAITDKNETAKPLPKSSKEEPLPKQIDGPTIIRSSKNKPQKPPARPPVKQIPNGKLKQGNNADQGGQVEAKVKPNIVRPPRPSKMKPDIKKNALVTDMPLLVANTDKKCHKNDMKKPPISPKKPVSLNTKLLEKELNSIHVEEPTTVKGISNSMFYLEPDPEEQNTPSVPIEQNGTQEQSKPYKRPAPKRPDRNPAKSATMKPVRSPQSKSPSRSPQNRSPALSPVLSRSKEKPTSNGVQMNKSRTLPPRLPKPLAPLPPQNPPVAPKMSKSSTIGGKGNEPSFQAYRSLQDETDAVNDVFDKEEGKLDEKSGSTFYLDFLVDGKEEDAEDLEIESVEQLIVQIKGQIESESNMLSGIETLLEFSDNEDKRVELLTRQRTLSSSLMDLNDALGAYQDEKSYLLASIGDCQAIRDRIEELCDKIQSYKTNEAKLRRMKDIATIEELAEIRDAIEFCENMVETLSEEMTALKKKLEEEEQLPQKEDPAEVRRKLLNQREKAITELIKTERDYVRDIDLCARKILPQLAQSKNLDCETLFGNLDEICETSKKLLNSFDKIDRENEVNIGEQISQCFANVSFDLKGEYSRYCRNYDDSQILLEKLEQDMEKRDEIFSAITAIRDETGLWDLSSYLIKPVQRILKYPLLLEEIYKLSPDDDQDRESIQEAIKILRNVASAINEFKRRKDLVQKYQRSEGKGNRIQRLNWHSVRKKSSRINQKITQFTGLNSQTVDDAFNEEEKRFRNIEKLIKNFIRNLSLYLEYFQESSHLQRIVAEDIKVLCAEAAIYSEVESYYNLVIRMRDVICPKFMFAVKSRVFDPLDRLLQLFQSPSKLIEKRQDKCLDYDRMLNRAQKNKDADKNRQITNELKMAKNNYEALNSQLLEELPHLSNKCINFFHSCLKNLVKARLTYISAITDELKLTLQFHLIEKRSSAEIMQKNAECLVVAAEKISQLIFYPEKIVAGMDGPMKPEALNLSRETFSNFYVDMFLEPNEGDPTSPIKPTPDNRNETPPPVSRNEADQTDNSKPIPLPRRRSLRRSSSSQSPVSPTKLPGFLAERNAKESRIERLPSTEEHMTGDLYLVEHTFEKEDAAEISVEEGAIVNVIRKHDKEGNSEWWLIETSSGRGYIPSAYLSPCEVNQGNKERLHAKDGVVFSISNPKDENVHNGSSNSKMEIETNFDNGNHTMAKPRDMTIKRQQSSDTPPLPQSPNKDNKSPLKEKDKVMVYRALYDFEATEDEEISITEGALVRILKMGDDNGNMEWSCIELQGKTGYVPTNYLENIDGLRS